MPTMVLLLGSQWSSRCTPSFLMQRRGQQALQDAQQKLGPGGRPAAVKEELARLLRDYQGAAGS